MSSLGPLTKLVSALCCVTALGGCGNGLDTIVSTTVPLYVRAVLGESGLISYWRMNETSGATLKNSAPSPAFSDIALGGTVGTDFAFGGAGPLFGLGDQAIQFFVTNGSAPWTGGRGDGTINAGTFTVVPGSFTVEAWVKYSRSTGGTPFIKIGLSGNAYVRLDATDGGNPASPLTANTEAEFYVNDSTNGPSSANEGPRPGASADGNWHHLVGVLDTGGVARLYVDGAQVGVSGTTAFGGNLNMGSGFNVAYDQQDSDTPHITAGISNVAVYNAALGPAVIADHYRIGIQGQ